MRFFLKLSYRCLCALIAFTVIYLFISSITNKLIVGGRWSTGMFLGGVDNWFAGGTIYSNPQDDGGLPIGPIYSPGGVFVALIARLVFGYNAETAIIILGGIICLTTFWGFSHLVSNTIGKRFWLFIACVALFVYEFPSAKSYAYEIHPDIPTLMFFIWGVLLTNKYLVNNNKVIFAFSIILFFFSGIFKANALFLYLGVGIFTLTSRSLTKQQKIAVFTSEITAGIGVLVTTISLKGCWYNSITVMSMHPYSDIHQYIGYIVSTINANKYYLVLLIITSVLTITKRIHINGIAERMWFYSSLLWFIFGMFGTLKIGSNNGNVEASIIVFMPFILKTIDYIYERAQNISNRIKWSPLVFVINIAVMAYIGLQCIFRDYAATFHIKSNIHAYMQRIEKQKEFAQWLNSNHKGENVAYYAGVYEVLNGSNIQKKTDLHILAHLTNANLLSEDIISNISHKEKWDMVITIPALKKRTWLTTLLNEYTKLDNNTYPLCVLGKDSVVVYVRNKHDTGTALK